MLFTSYEFIGFILVLFALYYLIPTRHQWKLLLLFSYIFYFLANPAYLFFIAATTAVVYTAAFFIAKINLQQKEYLHENKDILSSDEKRDFRAGVKKKKQKWLFFALFISLGILAVTKYTNFTIVNINAILRTSGNENQLALLGIIIPLGISFYTFQAVSYLLDVYRGTVEAERNPFRFALFVSFFPQLIQGPISRFADLSKTLFAPQVFDWHKVSFGLQRILWGFFKKLVIADRILVIFNVLIADSEKYSGAYVLVTMLLYAALLYADFTGGIDITIGIAQTLGIKVAENFHRPYFSKSVKEYWRRWHMSMGTWFADYLFYPLTASKPFLRLSKWSRKRLGRRVGKRVPIYLATFIVWFTTGLWHGASWNFIVWGLANWFVIIVSQEFEPFYEYFHRHWKIKEQVLFKVFQVVRTVLIMSLIRSFDFYRDVPLTFRMWGTMFTEGNWRVISDGSLLEMGLDGADFVVLLIAIIIVTLASLRQRKAPLREQIAALPYWFRFGIWYGLFLIVLIFGAYGVGYDAAQFIYNQF
ncbi:MAG: MBOAT family protein [Lachnospiraceae bacterium]|jgi:D-alanyl-lipoteichoic acid acyltransferase DltB (MBOAT superfamily)|nr:MBOAT family protein [Lachnospiraceae bacterium]